MLRPISADGLGVFGGSWKKSALSLAEPLEAIDTFDEPTALSDFEVPMTPFLRRSARAPSSRECLLSPRGPVIVTSNSSVVGPRRLDRCLQVRPEAHCREERW
jgi:hypothetical protein